MAGEDKALTEADHALIRAIDNDDDAGIRTALDAGANPNLAGTEPGSAPILIAAAATRDEELVRLLLAHKADPNIRHDHGGRQLTAILYLGWFGSCPEHHRILDQLVSAGGDVNAVADNGWNALDIAARNENTEMVRHLLALGATSSRKATTVAVSRLLDPNKCQRP